MPIVQTVMDALTKRYGADEGQRVYYAMEAEGKGPFGPNGKYHDLHVAFAQKHGVAPLKGKKKPRPSKKAGARSSARRKR